jgi:predicted lipoprotein with Yx(FWY)xxD motif
MLSPLSPGGRGRRATQVRRITIIWLGLVVLAFGSLTGLAVANASTTLGTAKAKVKGTSETIVVGPRGATVYTLSGESTHHLVCTPQAKPKGMCFHFWPPLKVRSAKTKLTAAHGIKGKLGLLHRNGFFQVTLSGHPLYYFLEDAGKKGSATGQGIVAFGGTWHVVKP